MDWSRKGDAQDARQWSRAARWSLSGSSWDRGCPAIGVQPPQLAYSPVQSLYYGGERGIRTLDRVSPIHAFQACAFNHSAISPGTTRQIVLIRIARDLAQAPAARLLTMIAWPFDGYRAAPC